MSYQDTMLTMKAGRWWIISQFPKVLRDPRHSQRVQVPLKYLDGPQSHDIVARLRPKHIPQTYMDPLTL